MRNKDIDGAGLEIFHRGRNLSLVPLYSQECFILHLVRCAVSSFPVSMKSWKIMILTSGGACSINS